MLNKFLKFALFFVAAETRNGKGWLRKLDSEEVPDIEVLMTMQ